MDAQMVFGLGLLIGLSGGAWASRREAKQPPKTWQHDFGEQVFSIAKELAESALFVGPGMVVSRKFRGAFKSGPKRRVPVTITFCAEVKEHDE